MQSFDEHVVGLLIAADFALATASGRTRPAPQRRSEAMPPEQFEPQDDDPGTSGHQVERSQGPAAGRWEPVTIGSIF
jgi:hypothetical protein